MEIAVPGRGILRRRGTEKNHVIVLILPSIHLRTNMFFIFSVNSLQTKVLSKEKDSKRSLPWKDEGLEDFCCKSVYLNMWWACTMFRLRSVLIVVCRAWTEVSPSITAFVALCMTPMLLNSQRIGPLGGSVRFWIQKTQSHQCPTLFCDISTCYCQCGEAAGSSFPCTWLKLGPVQAWQRGKYSPS